MMSKPNVLFLLSDEHSFRFLGREAAESPRANLYENVVTPALDRLASGGTLFADAYCQMPLCTPSRISLLTGLEPRSCGAWSNGSVLRPELPTMGSVFGDAGYRTALIGKMHLGGRPQFAGFQNRPYGDLTGKTGHQWEPIDLEVRHSMRQRTAGAGVTGIPESLLQEQVTAQETVAWIREQEAQSDQPWFALASFSRPHFPLTAPRRWIDHYSSTEVSSPMFGATGDAFAHAMSRGMRAGFQADAISEDEQQSARAAYFSCVSYLDEVIGDLLSRLAGSGSLENTIIVYTSDHGEMAGEHGVWWKNGWYEACTRVPLILSTPQQRAGGHGAGNRCSTPVGLIDLLPTLCSLSGVPTPSGLAGRDISPAIAGELLEDVPVSCDSLTARWGAGTEFRSVRYGDFKYIRFRDATPLAFNIATDPGEQHNLLSDAESGEYDAEELVQARHFAEQSIDFDAADQERTVRDGALEEQYKLGIDRGSGNFYIYPDGSLVNADDAMLYERRIHAADAEAIFAVGSDNRSE
jgi:choline-sulfatase